MSLVLVREQICSIYVPHHVPAKKHISYGTKFFKTMLLAMCEHLHLCHQSESPTDWSAPQTNQPHTISRPAPQHTPAPSRVPCPTRTIRLQPVQTHLGSTWCLLGSIWVPFGFQSGFHLGSTWGLLGSIWVPFGFHLGSIWVPFAFHLGPPGFHLGPAHSHPSTATTSTTEA